MKTCIKAVKIKAVLPVEEVDTTPQYLEIYDVASINEGTIVVQQQSEFQLYKEWIVI